MELQFDLSLTFVLPSLRASCRSRIEVEARR
jgi:hypothetical protein